MSKLERVQGTITWLLNRANVRAHALLTDAFARQGVRGYHFRLLAGLEQHGPCSQADLGRATGLDRSDIVLTLDELVSWGLAARTRDSEDARRNVVSITDLGTTRLAGLQLVLDDVQEIVLAALDAEERQTLTRLLRKLEDG